MKGATATIQCKEEMANTYATITRCTGLENTLEECSLMATTIQSCNECTKNIYPTVKLACQPGTYT